MRCVTQWQIICNRISRVPVTMLTWLLSDCWSWKKLPANCQISVTQMKPRTYLKWYTHLLVTLADQLNYGNLHSPMIYLITYTYQMVLSCVDTIDWSSHTPWSSIGVWTQIISGYSTVSLSFGIDFLKVFTQIFLFRLRMQTIVSFFDSSLCCL